MLMVRCSSATNWMADGTHFGCQFHSSPFEVDWQTVMRFSGERLMMFCDVYLGHKRAEMWYMCSVFADRDPLGRICAFKNKIQIPSWCALPCLITHYILFHIWGSSDIEVFITFHPCHSVLGSVTLLLQFPSPTPSLSCWFLFSV